MADFVRKNWQCDDTITADDLNRLEGGVEEALSGGDKGYSCTEGWVTLTDESVTTTIVDDNPFADGDLVYSVRITADTIKVTFNGTEYTVPVFVDTTPLGTVYLYGAQYSNESNSYDFSTYPFSIQSNPGVNTSNNIFTETAGTYQVKVEALEETIETSECFDKARGYSCSGGDTTTLVDETVTFSSMTE